MSIIDKSKLPSVGQRFSAIGPEWTVKEVDEEKELITLFGEGKHSGKFEAEIKITLKQFQFLTELGFMIRFFDGSDFGKGFEKIAIE